MFNSLKEQIRKEIGNKKVIGINDDVAKSLRERAETALNNKHFDEYIACYEIIAEDLERYENEIGNIPKKESSAAVAYQAVLAKYSDCGYGNHKEVLDLAKRCRRDVDDMMGSDSMWGPVDMSLVDSMCAIDIDSNFNEVERIALRDLNIAKRIFSQFPNEDMSRTTIYLASEILMKAYVYKERYKDAVELFYNDIPNEVADSNEVAVVSLKLFVWVLEIYGITGLAELSGSDTSKFIDNLKLVAEKKFPEANWILGIMSAEGYRIPVDIAKAKDYFEKGNKYAENVKGYVGYTDFDFKVLSPISQDEIIMKAQKGIYQSKFYMAKEKIKNAPTQNTLNSNNSSSSSSDGCYVATCVYGSYDCPQVWTLRRFRDNILRQNFFGKLFVKLYYAVSPTAVRLFGNYKWFHRLFEKPLDELVAKLNEKGIDDTPYYDR